MNYSTACDNLQLRAELGINLNIFEARVVLTMVFSAVHAATIIEPITQAAEKPVKRAQTG